MATHRGKQAQIEKLRSLMDSVDGGAFAKDYGAFDKRPADPEASDSAPTARKSGGDAVKSDGGEDDPAKRAYQRVLVLCGYHEFSKAAMRKRLVSEEFDIEAIEYALAKSEAIGALDDMRWAEMRAFTLYGRGMGQAGIERELRDNGIEAQALAGWPDEFASRYGAELDRALNVLEASPPRSKNKRQGAYGKLIRKGYSASVASEASQLWIDRMNQVDALE